MTTETGGVHWVVETLIGGSFENVWTDEFEDNGVLMIVESGFKTSQEASAALKEHREDCKEAKISYNRADFRIVSKPNSELRAARPFNAETNA